MFDTEISERNGKPCACNVTIVGSIGANAGGGGSYGGGFKGGKGKGKSFSPY